MKKNGKKQKFGYFLGEKKKKKRKIEKKILRCDPQYFAISKIERKMGRNCFSTYI